MPKFRPILEVHRVKAHPAPAPDEAVLFKDAYDLFGDLIAVAAVLAPAPVVAFIGIYVDRDTVGVRALALCALDHSPVKGTRRVVKKF